MAYRQELDQTTDAPMNVEFYRFRLHVLLTVMLCLLAGSAFAADPVRIGVLAFRPKPQTLQQWQPLAIALKQAIPAHDFVVEAYTYPELDAAVAERRIDFILTNSGHYVLLKKREGLSSPLATLIADENGKNASVFGGVIFSRSSTQHLDTLADLKGKTIAVASTESLGGYQMQAYELSKAGIHLPQDATLLSTGMPHDNVIVAVLAGRAEVGFVRSGVLENMIREGRLDPKRIKVLNPWAQPDFFHQSSTRLYPEWPIAAMPQVDPSLARRIAATLFTLEDNPLVTRAIGVHGFTIPADYSAVEELLRELHLPPFDQAHEFTAQDVWSRYQWQWLTAILALLLILLLTAFLLKMNLHLKRKQRKLAMETTLRNNLLNSMGEGVYGVDQHGLCIFANPAALMMLGVSETELIGRNQHLLFHHHRIDNTPYPEQECPIYQTLIDGHTRSGEEWFWRKNGAGFHVFVTVTANEATNGAAGAVVVFRDITAQKLNEERMLHLSQHDTLTELPNRALLNDRLQQALASARRDQTHMALLFLDLDKFKPINDSLGHAVGDLLLKEVAKRLKACVRESDTVARVGGDEFIILLPVIDEEEDALRVAEKIRHSLNQSFSLVGYTLNISSSTGVAVYPEHGTEEMQLIKNADIAMYYAKKSGRNDVMLYRANMQEASS
ncbi:MAG: diguanylate cyclase [Gallionella sp.]|jgi:diguanylate cyclase (GGDEF)-like protein/PAS domain S-box-containing protein